MQNIPNAPAPRRSCTKRTTNTTASANGIASAPGLANAAATVKGMTSQYRRRIIARSAANIRKKNMLSA